MATATVTKKVKQNSNQRTKTDNELKANLFGILEICKFTGRTAATLIDWMNIYQCPIWKENNILVSSKEMLNDWVNKRECNFETINDEILSSFREDQLRKADEKLFNRELNNLSEITSFCNVSDVTALDWLNIDNCPIKRSPEGYSVDADELYFWLKDMGMPCKFDYSFKSAALNS